MSLSQNRLFAEVVNPLTKNEKGHLKRLKYFITSSGAYKEIKNHPKTTAADGEYLTIGSAGGCRFIQGPVGDLRCGCHDPGQCHKGRGSIVCEISPRCFQYHDRHVHGVPV